MGIDGWEKLGRVFDIEMEKLKLKHARIVYGRIGSTSRFLNPHDLERSFDLLGQ